MNFDLHLYGETPEELLNVLAHLGHMDSNHHTPIPDERHPAQAPTPQPQNEPVPQPDKPKAQTPANQKKATQKPAATPAEEPANPTTAEASNSPSQEDAAPATSASAPKSEPASDPATLDKIRDLARSLIVAGKLPPDSYTSVWEELLKLKDEVGANATN